MKYENGKDIFPEHLLKQIQKYASGKLVYIPAGESRRAWGETSGYKQYLLERNRSIRLKFSQGATIEQLAEEQDLSWESWRTGCTPISCRTGTTGNFQTGSSCSTGIF